MSMTIAHALDVADELLRQSSDLRDSIRCARVAVPEARGKAEELKLQCGEFTTSDAAFGRPIVFDAAATQASYIAETLDPETCADQDEGLGIAERAVDELAEILKLGIEHLRVEAKDGPASNGNASTEEGENV